MASFMADRACAPAATESHAFGRLYEMYCHAVYNHCFRRTGSWAAAEDLVAAAFLEAWRHRRAAPPDPAAALPWLLAITNNVLRNRRRAERRYASAVARLPPPETVADAASTIAAKVDAERQMATLLPLLRALPERERQVIELCLGDGLTHAEAAEALRVPVGTVKSRLSRGVARLRRAGAAAGLTVNAVATQGGKE
jgi:RNA polymerase sigma factor (sigma-70 family)